MLTTSEKDPPELVADFIGGLSTTIRNIVATMVHARALRRPVNAETDFVLELRAFLMNSETDPAWRIGPLLCVVGVVDYLLMCLHYLRPERKKSLAELARKDPSFETIAMKNKMNERHFTAAYERWRAERETSQGRLGPAALHAYEKRLIETGR